MIRAVVVIFSTLLLPSFVFAQSLEWLQEHPGMTSAAMQQASTSAEIPAVKTNSGIENSVRQYFSDTPVMAEIARCESGFRQYSSSGSALDGGAGGMIGIFQINAAVHAAYAKSIGMDIYAPEGNMAYAKKLYQEEGTDPWLSSFSCWHVSEKTGSSDSSVLTKDLVLGVIDDQVLTLQKLLNQNGFVLAQSGPGSPGQETNKFGSLTRTAVRAFQCAKSISCSGDEGTTGFGLVGASTRVALSSFASPMANAQTSPEAQQIAALQKQIQELSAQLFSLQQKLAMR